MLDGKRLTGEPVSLTVKESVELLLSLKNVRKTLGRRKHELIALRLGSKATCWDGIYEFQRLAEAFRDLARRTRDLSESMSSEDEASELLRKLRFLFDLEASQIILFPDEAKSFPLVIYEDDSGTERLVCLSCTNWHCEGCSPMPGISSPEELRQRHGSLLGMTCRLCGVLDRTTESHRCGNFGSCGSAICKYTYQDRVKDLYKMDVRFEDNDVFPGKV